MDGRLSRQNDAQAHADMASRASAGKLLLVP
jgi:hypothetical protein